MKFGRLFFFSQESWRTNKQLFFSPKNWKTNSLIFDFLTEKTQSFPAILQWKLLKLTTIWHLFCGRRSLKMVKRDSITIICPLKQAKMKSMETNGISQPNRIDRIYIYLHCELQPFALQKLRKDWYLGAWKLSRKNGTSEEESPNSFATLEVKWRLASGDFLWDFDESTGSVPMIQQENQVILVKWSFRFRYIKSWCIKERLRTFLRKFLTRNCFLIIWNRAKRHLSSSQQARKWYYQTIYKLFASLSLDQAQSNSFLCFFLKTQVNSAIKNLTVNVFCGTAPKLTAGTPENEVPRYEKGTSSSIHLHFGVPWTLDP